VDKVLPLVQSAAALHDPVPLPEAIRTLFRFLMRTTGARDGVLIARSFDARREPPEICKAYDADGLLITAELVPFARSVAATVLSMQQPSAMTRLDQLAAQGTLELQPFEQGRHSLMAAPLPVSPGVHVILELFDKQGPQGDLAEDGFNAEDHQLIGAAAELGTEMLRHALAERQTHQVLFDAIGAALGAGESVAESLRRSSAQRLEEPLAPAVMDQLRQGLSTNLGTGADANDTMRLVEAIRVLTLRHGTAAVTYCIHLVEELRELLDRVSGTV
jgi:hypothetical protein